MRGAGCGGSRPNLVVVISDQHSPAAVGCHGGQARTPAIDGLASSGVDFTSTYCASPLCVPSRMALLTGRFPSDIGVWTNGCVLDSNRPTFAHALTSAGYDTVLCGRMHFLGPDQHHGFASRLVGDVSGARDETQPLFEGNIPEYLTGQKANSLSIAGAGETSYLAFDRDVTAAACRHLRRWRADASSDRFLLVVGYLSPHNPYICPPGLFDEYMAGTVGVDMTVPDDEFERMHPAMRRWRSVRAVDDITPLMAARARAAYLGLVTFLDEQVACLRDALRETGHEEDTVVAYVSDHGEMAGEHGLWWKESFYESSVSVPMVWSGPGIAARGVVGTPVSLLDVAPTLLELAGADPLPGARGTSLVPWLRETADRRCDSGVGRPVFAEMCPRDLFAARMVRDGRWKLSCYEGYDEPQLFDLAHDPGERADLRDSPGHRDTRDRLLELVRSGWSGEHVEAESAVREEEASITERWREATSVGESAIWSVPSGVNYLVDGDRP